MGGGGKGGKSKSAAPQAPKDPGPTRVPTALDPGLLAGLIGNPELNVPLTENSLPIATPGAYAPGLLQTLPNMVDYQNIDWNNYGSGPEFQFFRDYYFNMPKMIADYESKGRYGSQPATKAKTPLYTPFSGKGGSTLYDRTRSGMFM